MITPEILARTGSEHGHQAALFCQANLHLHQYPDLKWLFHIQNASANRSAKVVGVKAGVPDICLPVRRGAYSGLWIELKRPIGLAKKAGIASADQLEWIDHLRLEGYAAMICFGWEAAWINIVRYLKCQM